MTILDVKAVKIHFTSAEWEALCTIIEMVESIPNDVSKGIMNVSTNNVNLDTLLAQLYNLSQLNDCKIII